MPTPTPPGAHRRRRRNPLTRIRRTLTDARFLPIICGWGAGLGLTLYSSGSHWSGSILLGISILGILTLIGRILTNAGEFTPAGGFDGHTPRRNPLGRWIAHTCLWSQRNPRLSTFTSGAIVAAACGLSLIPHFPYPLSNTGFEIAIIVFLATSLCPVDRPLGEWARMRLAEDQPPLTDTDDTWTHGWKIAEIRRINDTYTLEGVAGGRYRDHADAHCLRNNTHTPPVETCTCGFHAWRSRALAEAYAVAYQDLGTYVLIEVALAGEILCYARGARASSQDILGVHLPPCRCGREAQRLSDTLTRGLAPTCTAHAGENAITLSELAGALGAEVHPQPARTP